MKECSFFPKSSYYSRFRPLECQKKSILDFYKKDISKKPFTLHVVDNLCKAKK